MIRVALLVFVALLAAAPAAAEHGRPSISLGFFYDSLAPHGEWLSSAQFGYVWRPLDVYGGWRPYVDGEWVYTDYGWTFVSYEPWGWATYHYGRWFLDPYWGWIWVPGYEWAPAWVVFHHGGGYVGWAPLPPHVSLSVVLGGGYRIDPRAYCFVEERWFVERSVRRHALPFERHGALIRSTRNVTRFDRRGDLYVNRSLSRERLERVVERHIGERRIVDVAGRARPSVGRDRLESFRPQVARGAVKPPRELSRKPTARASAGERRPDPRGVRPPSDPQRELRARVAERRSSPSLRYEKTGRPRERPIGVRGVAPRQPEERSVRTSQPRERGRPAGVEVRGGSPRERPEAALGRDAGRGKDRDRGGDRGSGKGRGRR